MANNNASTAYAVSINPNNDIRLTGRVARDLEEGKNIFVNKDGSVAIRFTIMVQRTYTDKNGKNYDAVPVEAFLPATKGRGANAVKREKGDYGIYGLLKRGMKINIFAHISVTPYTTSDGKTVYPTTIQINQIGGISFAETREEVAAREAREAKAATEQAETTEAEVAEAEVAETTYPADAEPEF